MSCSMFKLLTTHFSVKYISNGYAKLWLVVTVLAIKVAIHLMDK